MRIFSVFQTILLLVKILNSLTMSNTLNVFFQEAPSSHNAPPLGTPCPYSVTTGASSTSDRRCTPSITGFRMSAVSFRPTTACVMPSVTPRTFTTMGSTRRSTRSSHRSCRSWVGHSGWTVTNQLLYELFKFSMSVLPVRSTDILKNKLIII